MIGYHIDKTKIVSTEGKVQRGKESWLPWLLDNEPLEPRIFYDLDYSVACLLAHEGITEEQGKGLLDTHKLNLRNGYRLAYYPGKVFTIDYGYGAGHAFTYFYNAKQFTDTHHGRDRSVKYAISKAEIALEIANSVLSAYKKIGITNETLTSPINAFKKAHLYPVIPTVDTLPEEAGEYAYATIKGNWVESFKLGYFKMAYDYDLRGAYASELLKLPDLRSGKWIKKGGLPTDLNLVPYGFVKGILTIDATFHPFIYSEGERSTTPVGSYEAYLTLQEIDFLRRNKLGTFKPEVGWYWAIQGKPNYPFRRMVQKLWDLRQDADPVTSMVIKRILAGMWGMTLQLKGSNEDMEFGEHFNPVYGAIVEANSRLKVAQACIDSGITPLAVAVDGVICDKPLNVECNGGLGDWKLSHQGKCLVLSSGITGIEGKDANEDFSITYEWLSKALRSAPRQSEYVMKKTSPVTLARAMNSEGWGNLGNLIETSRFIYIGGDTKRCYPTEPKTGNDILTNTYTGQPWDISIVRDSI